MAGFLYKGILLQQHKEPALSRDLREFFNADTVAIQMERQAVAHPDELTPLEIIELAREAHIIDECDGQPLAGKLNRCRGRVTKLVVGDAIDDEPYISSQLNPLLKNQKLTAIGLELTKRAVGAGNAYFAVYKNLTDLDVKIPKMIGDFHVKRIRGRYPAEYQASKNYGGGEATLVVGAGALLHLARAVVFNKPQSTAFITVAGNCVGNPTNLEVSLGMTVSQVLERCGLVQNPARVIIGGSMTGISVIDTEKTLINATTRAVLAFREEDKDLNFNCIGCSRCVHVCPEGLNPFYLYRSVKGKRYDEFRSLDAQMCIGCGTCSYMCPAKLDLSATIREGSEEFRRMTGSMRTASVVAAKRDAEEFALYMNQYHNDRDARIAVRAEYRRRIHEWMQRTGKHINDKVADLRVRAAEAAEKRASEAAIRAEENAVKAAAKAVIDAENARIKAIMDAEKAAAKAVIDAEKARLKEIADAERARIKAELDAVRAAEKEKADIAKAAAKVVSDAAKAAARAEAETARVLAAEAKAKAKAETDAANAAAKALVDAARIKAKAEAAAIAETARIKAEAEAEATRVLEEAARLRIAAAETAEAAARLKAELDGVEFDEEWFPSETPAATDEETKADGAFHNPAFVSSGRVAPEEIPAEFFLEDELSDEEADDELHGWNKAPREPETTGGRTK